MSYAISKDSTLWIWGHNVYRQLGRDLSKFVFKPTKQPDLNGVVKIAGGITHSIALTADGSVWMWGKNDKGELGTNNPDGNLIPVKVALGGKATSIDAGNNYSIVLY